MMRKRTKDYEQSLTERLKEPEYAAGYLNAVLEDTEEGAKERFLMALRDVAKAHGMSRLAQETDLAREAMYRTLSEEGNPEFETLTSLLSAIGLRLSVTVEKKGKLTTFHLPLIDLSALRLLGLVQFPRI